MKTKYNTTVAEAMARAAKRRIKMEALKAKVSK